MNIFLRRTKYASIQTELCAQHFTTSKNFSFKFVVVVVVVVVIRICNNIIRVFVTGNLKKLNCGTKLILHFKDDVRAL